MMQSFVYALFRFEYNVKGVPIEKLVLCSSEEQPLIDHHRRKFSRPQKRIDLSGPLVRYKPKNVALFSKDGGPYFGYYIDKVRLLATTPRTERKRR